MNSPVMPKTARMLAPQKIAVDPRPRPVTTTKSSIQCSFSASASQPIQPFGGTGSLFVDSSQIVDTRFLEIELGRRQFTCVLGWLVLQLLRGHPLYPARTWCPEFRHAGFELVGSRLHSEGGRLVRSWTVRDNWLRQSRHALLGSTRGWPGGFAEDGVGVCSCLSLFVLT